MSFLGLVAHFLLVMNSIPLSGWSTVYLSPHLLKDIMVADEAAVNICAQVFGLDLSFPLIQVISRSTFVGLYVHKCLFNEGNMLHYCGKDIWV